MSEPQPAVRLYRGRVADQIIDDLRTQILSGVLPDGARLPAERELAAGYGVSPATVREAIRVLTSMGLVNTRNGSRTTVTAQGDTLLAMSIASVVQFEKVGTREVFGLLGALNAYAAELAAEHASDEEIARLRAAAEHAAQTEAVPDSAAALRDFFRTLAEISHNPLLAALCRFITEMQLGLALKLSRGKSGDWGQVSSRMHEGRIAIADAIAGRDPARAASMVRDYHRQVVDRIVAVGGDKARAEATLTADLNEWLRTNVGLGGQDRGHNHDHDHHHRGHGS
jgi:GntR family transcriptional regulator, transcriptional repressor for pyruvate dehydrogenase complex